MLVPTFIISKTFYNIRFCVRRLLHTEEYYYAYGYNFNYNYLLYRALSQGNRYKYIIDTAQFILSKFHCLTLTFVPLLSTLKAPPLK